MQLIAQHPFRFGRGPLRLVELEPAPAPAAPISGDLKLFATTFLAGFVFVSILIA
jgi:hypothetical protein